MYTPVNRSLIYELCNEKACFAYVRSHQRLCFHNIQIVKNIRSFKLLTILCGGTAGFCQTWSERFSRFKAHIKVWFKIDTITWAY